MSRNLDLGAIFDTVSKNMQNDFDRIRNIMSHPLEKGKSIEETFSKFLSYFHKSLMISTGFIFDSDGKMSNQLDVIISDAAHWPIFD